MLSELAERRNHNSATVSRRWLRHGRWYFVIAGAFLVCLWAIAAGWPPPVTATDVDQQRLDVALLPPQPGQPIAQDFTAEHDGLASVEVLLARTADAGGGDFRMTLWQDERLIAENTWSGQMLRHNQPLSLRFGPLPESAGKTYELRLDGDGGSRFSAWAYSLDVYAGGALEAPGQPDAKELRFTTRYQLQFGSALGELIATTGRLLPIAVLSAGILWLPGVILLMLTGAWLPRLDPVAWIGVALGAGAATWPLLWYWLTRLGGRWTPPSLWIFLVLGWGFAAWLYRRRRGTLTHGWRRGHLLLLLVVLIGLSVRLLAVRDLSFPPWVDASRHALITAVMADRGQTISTYEPYLPVTRFPYHFGFHTLPAGMLIMANWRLPELLLFLGQWLNALIPVTVFAATWLIARRIRAGLIAAFLVALPFLFPAYYTTWGRLTQLQGALLLPLLLAFSWLLVRGAVGWRHSWWLLGLLAAGLSLIHFRVFLVFLPFPLLLWLFSRGRRGRSLAAAFALALLLAGPRLLELAAPARNRGLLTVAGDDYATFPTGYVTAGWERYFLLVGAVAVVLALVAVLRRRAWASWSLFVAAWVALIGLLLSPVLPTPWLINLNSAYILLFAPLALLLGAATSRAFRFGRRLPWWLQALGALLTGGLATVLLLFGIHQQITIINEETILAYEADEAALAWASQELSPSTLVAVNSWQWLAGTWTSSDGGAWLVPLTAQVASGPVASTTPPVDYIYGADLRRTVNAFNQSAQAIEDWSQAEAATWLQNQGVTHIFVGARGGFFDPAELSRNPRIEALFAHDGAFVFAVRR